MILPEVVPARVEVAVDSALTDIGFALAYGRQNASEEYLEHLQKSFQLLNEMGVQLSKLREADEQARRDEYQRMEDRDARDRKQGNKPWKTY